MFAALFYVVVLLVCCVTTNNALPQQQYYYVPQGPPQHYGVVSPLNYNTPGGVGGVATAVPAGGGGYNPMYNPPPMYYPSTQQFYYNNYPQQHTPPFVFYYPGAGQLPPTHQIPVMPQSPPQHQPPFAAPRPPPIDETGDSETVSVTINEAAGEPDSSERREPLIPGNVALSGPETGKRVGMPEKHIQPKPVQSQIYRFKQPQNFGMLTKAAVQRRPEPITHQEYKRTSVTKEKLQAEEIPQQNIQSRMDTNEADNKPSEEEVRALAESEGRRLRAESRQWRRRLAPNLQSVYLEAEEVTSEDDKNKKTEEGGDSVAVNNDPPAGPSVASVKPAAIALAGPGGVASASPVGTAISGPNGLSVAAPSATAIAGASGGVPPGTLGVGGASARSNMRIYDILEALYSKPARRAVSRVSQSAYASDDYDY